MKIDRRTLPGLIPALLLFTWAGACPGGDQPHAGGGIRHVVLCWLKQPGNAAQIDELIRVSRELSSIPGVDDLVAGRALPSDRPIVDDSFDVGVVMRFASADAMRAYLDDPEHQRRVRETLQPLCGRVVVYDIRDAGGP